MVFLTIDLGSLLGIVTYFLLLWIIMVYNCVVVSDYNAPTRIFTKATFKKYKNIVKSRNLTYFDITITNFDFVVCFDFIMTNKLFRNRGPRQQNNFILRFVNKRSP